jgi:hypothetical protein
MFEMRVARSPAFDQALGQPVKPCEVRTNHVCAWRSTSGYSPVQGLARTMKRRPASEEAGMKHCAQCGGKFGLIRRRWFGYQFCSSSCRDNFFDKLALDRERLRKWLGYLKPG